MLVEGYNPFFPSDESNLDTKMLGGALTFEGICWMDTSISFKSMISKPPDSGYLSSMESSPIFGCSAHYKMLALSGSGHFLQHFDFFQAW
jgi:hypothetical protein